MSLPAPLYLHLLWVAACFWSGVTMAQQQTSASAPTTLSSPIGKGPGYHSPLSPFKPLQELEGVVPWRVLASVTTRPVKGRLEPVFPDPVKALNATRVKVQGFMMPLDAGMKQRRFLLSSVPTTCQFCVPAGPEGLIEVRSKVPVKYGIEAFVMQGTLHVLQHDDMGLYYRLTEAEPASP
jgi:uncharacterized protein